MATLLFGNDSNVILDGMRLAADNSAINDAALTLHLFTTTGSKTVTAASNATPIVITSTAHGLANGAEIVVAHVLGNTAANGRWIVANVTANTFELVSSVGNGAYIRGGNIYNAVTNATQIPLTYQASSNGKYVGVVPSGINLLAGESCRAIVFCSNYNFQIERDHVMSLRT